MSFAVSQPSAEHMKTNTRSRVQPTSAMESSISALATESSIVKTSRTLSTTLEPERVNSGP